MPQTLIVRHLGDFDFKVLRGSDSKNSEQVTLSAPESVLVEGRPDSNLLQDLSWYLEQYLDYPFSPNTDIAIRILEALDEWGKSAFDSLFTGQALLWYNLIDR